ncbi:MAG TPA: hypothetical protein PK447_05140, partial [Ignavibacteria bacterium]|nr:hypothetical protein [Ignavibacteria bacterium]
MNFISELQNIIPVIIMAAGGLFTLMLGAFWKKSVTVNYFISIITVIASIINYFSLNLTDFLLYNLIWIKIGVIVLLLVPILFLRKKLKKKE